MPWVYGALLCGEIGSLTWRYATAAPAPTDPLSVDLGWVGLGSMVVLLAYSVARRSRRLRQVARLSYWLHFHIFLALQAMVCVFFHCFHLFGRDAPLRLLNPGVLNLIAVLVVFGSGIFGRYLYSWLPRQIGGVQMGRKEVEAELAQIGAAFSAEVEALWQRPATEPRGLVGLIRSDLATRRALRELRRLDLPAQQLAVAERKVRLERSGAVLAVSQRFFRNWIILHRPIAAIMYVLSVVHVLLSYMFTPTLG